MDLIRRIPASWLIVPAVLLFFWLALNSMVMDSPTVDEQNHMARGAAFLRTGDPRLSLEHPPLVNAISALPLMTLPGLRLPFDHESWERQPPDVYWYRFAEQFLWVYNDDVSRMVFLARAPILFLTLGLALVGYHFAAQLWGRPSAIWSLLFLLFDPNVLAHGRYATTDLGGATFIFLAAFLLWRLWQTDGWHWRRWLLAGVSLGLAFGSKLSALGFVPIFGLLAVLPLYHPPGVRNRGWQVRGGGRRLLQFMAAGALSVIIVWANFGFEWGQFQFRSPEWGGLAGWSGPMPTFWAGLEQVLGISSGGRPAFLLGHFSNQGFWYYFPVAFLVKTPLLTLLGLGLTAVLLLRQFSTRRRALFLLIPIILYFLFSMQSALNIGYRHLLPILPFAYLLISGAANGMWPGISRITQYISRFTPVVVFLGLIVADLAIHPHYLSYFNLAAGGPDNGRNVLIDSNIDWGQDLLRLKQWMVENEVDSLKLGWFGTAVPEYYDIHYEPLPGSPLPQFYSLWGSPPFDPSAPEPGLYAISVTSLWELPLPDDQKYVYPWFRARQPDEQIGYSIMIYRVP